MAQKYSFVKVEGSFITCNNKIITASASASATGNTIEESDNTAYMYAKQNLELSAQENARENNLIIKKLIKIKTVAATNINNDTLEEDKERENTGMDVDEEVNNTFYEVDDLSTEKCNDIMDIEEITNTLLLNKTETEIHDEIEYILDAQSQNQNKNKNKKNPQKINVFNICHLHENI